MTYFSTILRTVFVVLMLSTTTKQSIATQSVSCSNFARTTLTEKPLEVAQMGVPGERQFVFCDQAACPKHTTKHLNEPSHETVADASGAQGGNARTQPNKPPSAPDSATATPSPQPVAEPKIELTKETKQAKKVKTKPKHKKHTPKVEPKQKPDTHCETKS